MTQFADTQDRANSMASSNVRSLKSFAPEKTATNSVEKDEWYQYFYNVFNSFFDHESNVLDEDEDENVRRSDENDENESNDTETLERDIAEAEVYEAIRMLKMGRRQDPIGLLENSSRTLLHTLSHFYYGVLTSFFIRACTRTAGQKQLFSFCLRKAILLSLIITQAFLS